MNVLNIHGYHGMAENAAFGALKAYGCSVISPEMDYDSISPDSNLATLGVILAEQKTDCIVGTSLGGFFAAVLAARTGLPAILVNPCLLAFYHLPTLGYLGDTEPYIQLFGELSKLKRSQVSVIVGGSDTTVTTHHITQAMYDSPRFRIIPNGEHSGATLPLPAYFEEILNGLGSSQTIE